MIVVKSTNIDMMLIIASIVVTSITSRKNIVLIFFLDNHLL